MLEELKTFIAVVECKNFTRAAENINLSQPSVSLHIKRLEEYFNTTLIQRSIKQKNIVVTKSGKLLYKRGKQILSLLEDTRYELLDYSKSIRGELKIGASFTIGEYFLPAFLGVFSKEYPELKLQVKIKNTADICKKVENLEVDLGLIEGIVPSDKFDYENFYRDKMVLAVSHSNLIANRKFSKKNYENQTWITREEGSGTREYLNIFLENNEIVPKDIIVLGSNYAVKEAVRNNLGVTFISEHIAKIAEKNKELKIVNTNKEYTRSFSYILPKNIILSNATKALIYKIKDYFNNIVI
ncbi:LysR family transcriptional regulator [Clostridium novyi A str. 4552]|uniref:LysR family transcriptional regulator n=1 Tax=Clostridium novyi A str. 4552 TaxID=1444289 RepID=A0A0A0I8S8_CLONO|nr:LysR family transcriptional regulator [Clostridium novyi]KGM97237.1 LysR family transcriptional regulator [Clostridium novyi A str. 4552]